MTVAGSKAGSTARRQNMPSAMTVKALVSGRDVERGRDAALVLHALEQLLEALGDEAVDALEDLADARVARRIPGRSRCTCGGLSAGSSRKYCSPSSRSACMKVGGLGKRGEPLGELGAVALADAGDQRFLAVEIDVERAGADARLLADVVHGGAMEAGAGKAALGGIEDVLAARRAGCRA